MKADNLKLCLFLKKIPPKVGMTMVGKGTSEHFLAKY